MVNKSKETLLVVVYGRERKRMGERSADKSETGVRRKEEETLSGVRRKEGEMKGGNGHQKNKWQ